MCSFHGLHLFTEVMEQGQPPLHTFQLASYSVALAQQLL